MPRVPPQSDLVVRAVETDEELRLANDLAAKAFTEKDYFSALHWLETCAAGYPGYRREHTRIALWRSEIAGVLRLNTDTIRMGEARLKMGGLDAVTTAPRHRHKGVCRALILDTLRYMRDHNYHVAMLFGIPNFYHQFGFTSALVDYTIVMDLEDATTASYGHLRVREAKPGDIPAIQRIHAANDADVACSLLRSSAHVTNKWDHRGKGTRVLMTEQGRVLAYFTAARKSDHLSVSEVGIADAALCDPVLAACARIAADEMVGRMHFLAPPPHPFARYLLQHKTTHQMHVVRDAGGMMAFVDVGETLENLIPEWESLVARSALRDRHVEFTLLVDRVPYRVRAHHGAIDVTPCPGSNKVSVTSEDLMHAVTGYLYVDDILAARRRMITAEARELLRVLFPKRHPYVWHFDRF